MAKKDKKDLGKTGKNITWELNHRIIRDSYVKLIKKYKRKPTIKEVSEDTKLTTTTIDKHLKELEFKPLKHPLRILSDDVILAIINSAKKGSAASQKLFMQILEGWSEKQEIEHTGEINLNEVREKLINKLKDANNKGNSKKS